MICKSCKKEFDEFKTEKKTFANGTKHIGAYCPVCGAYQQWLPQGGPDILYYGKYKDEKIEDIVKKDKRYLEWLKDNCKRSVKNKIEKYL